MTPDNPVRYSQRQGAGGGRTPTAIEELQHRAAALDAAARALLAHARTLADGHESRAYRAVGRQLLTERNLMIAKVVARGGHYYTGTRVKLEMRTGDGS